MSTRKRCTGTNNLALGMAKEIAGQADNSDKPRGGDLDISDLEMSGKILAWLVLEGIVGTKNLYYIHVGIFKDNTTAVSWTQRVATKHFKAGGNLLRVLGLR